MTAAGARARSALHLPLSPLFFLAVVVLAEGGGGVRDGSGAKDTAKDLASLAGLTGLPSGLPSGLSSLLKMRSGGGGGGGGGGGAQQRSAPAAPPPVGAATLDPNEYIKPPVFPEEEAWPGSCRLRSKRYVSDGLCVSTRPVNEVVCAVSCVMNAWSKQTGTRPLPWRCTDSGWKRQRVKLLCRDGSTRSYRIRVVQTCRCVPRARAAHANQLE
ncbi:Sclerostin domain-containing protein 1 [Frankliniella fusca]|uniref:Sclerostin domain-containing protein 1 n=1 Tax=Frankliniella fusca TaxID=407009 RepID=A0AAE1LI91_9NEOP|nr:Sclerostin domain-containing protein 1 [Frankliniella fusca]